MKKVLFACVHNSGRSQMAAAFFNSFCAPALAKAISAGTRPAERVQPEVIEAMKEIGFDLRSARPQLLTPELAAGAYALISFGCGESCPVIQGQRRLDWELPDPRGQSLDQVRRVRDELRGRVWRFVAKEGWYKLQPLAAFRSSVLQPGA